MIQQWLIPIALYHEATELEECLKAFRLPELSPGISAKLSTTARPLHIALSPDRSTVG
jgi:hypothetical protein